MRGTIETITVKSGSNSRGQWKKWGVKTENGWLSTFDKAIGAGLKEGQTYDFEVEQKGEFLTITGTHLVTEDPDPLDEELKLPAKPETPKVVPTQKPTPGISSPEERKEQAIARAVALKVAVEHPEIPVATIIARAEELEKWLTR